MIFTYFDKEAIMNIFRLFEVVDKSSGMFRDVLKNILPFVG